MRNLHFFDETTDHSRIKATIVSKYFFAWAKVITPSARAKGGKIAYLDLFAGPGRYKDGSKSTPLLILQQAIADSDMRKMLVTLFNDKDENHCRHLETAIRMLPGIETLLHQPTILTKEVGSEMVKQFESMKLVPTLFFVDPWGYKGLSLRLVDSVLKNWGCDCIFLFNYNRINMGLANPSVRHHMNALFSEARAEQLRDELGALRPEERESRIVQALCKALGEDCGRFVLPFRFRNDRGTRTSHHLIFVSKHFKGYEIMKQVMAKESSSRNQGVPSFEYNPQDVRVLKLLELTRPLDTLEGLLAHTFAGLQTTMHDVYLKHNVGHPFIERNYKDALMNLERRGQIICDPPADRRPKGTMGPQTKVRFPTPRQNGT
jgi:three-Cys-motif partner protein